jgi:hypothetical protein
VARFLTFVLAVILMTGVVGQGSASAAPTSYMVDAPDAPDLDPVVLPVGTELAPAVVVAREIVPPPLTAPTGRRHAVLVFRPPRALAFR